MKEKSYKGGMCLGRLAPILLLKVQLINSMFRTSVLRALKAMYCLANITTTFINPYPGEHNRTANGSRANEAIPIGSSVII